MVSQILIKVIVVLKQFVKVNISPQILHITTNLEGICIKIYYIDVDLTTLLVNENKSFYNERAIH